MDEGAKCSSPKKPLSLWGYLTRAGCPQDALLGVLTPPPGYWRQFVYGSTNRLISNSISRKYKSPGIVPLTLHTNRGFGQMLLWQAKLIKKLYKTDNTIIQLLVSLKGVAQCVEGVAQCV